MEKKSKEPCTAFGTFMKSCVFPRVLFHPLPLTQVWILKVFNRGPRVRRRQRKSGRHLLVGVADPQLSIGEAATVLIRAETGMFLESQGTLFACRRCGH